MTIKMITTNYALKNGTKTSWLVTESELTNITDEQYNNIIEAAPFFRRLGGSETLTREYTSAGFKVVKLVSKSPDRTLKTVRDFYFD